MNPKFLRNTETGVIFNYSDTIALQPWMEPYKPEKATQDKQVQEQERPLTIESTETEKKVKERLSDDVVMVMKEMESEPSFVPWVSYDDDGPVYRDVVKKANKQLVTLGRLDMFNPTSSDFKVAYNSVSVKSALSEFKRRAREGE